jgi:hypothetical protein
MEWNYPDLTSGPVREIGWSLRPKLVNISCSKVAHPMPEARTGGKDYNREVRYYTTKPMNGGTTFKCTFCEHTVTTLDFNSTNGNRRTQAAAVINEHAALLHLRASTPAKLGGRGAL